MDAAERRLVRGIILVAATLFALLEWRALTFPDFFGALVRGVRFYAPWTAWWQDLAVIVGGPVAHVALLRLRSVSVTVLAIVYRAAWVVILANLPMAAFDPVPLSEISFVYWLLMAVEGALLVASVALLRLRWREAIDEPWDETESAGRWRR